MYCHGSGVDSLRGNARLRSRFSIRSDSADGSRRHPTASVLGSTGADRADEVVPSLDRREALANAPDGHLDTGLFRVPRVIG